MLTVRSTGSVIVQAADGSHRNRMLWARPDGEVWHYDKRHLFRMAGEHNHYTPGERQVHPQQIRVPAGPQLAVQTTRTVEIAGAQRDTSLRAVDALHEGRSRGSEATKLRSEAVELLEGTRCLAATGP